MLRMAKYAQDDMDDILFRVIIFVNQRLTISVIITTYNNPEALRLVLSALTAQDDQDFEAVIADDGSDDKTKKVIDSFQLALSSNIFRVWQEHQEFRAAMIRNKAVAAANGEYLVFLDGDTVPDITFINKHRKLAQKGFFVSGNRILLSQKFTEKVLAQNIPIHAWRLWNWFYAFCCGWINKFLALLPFGNLYYKFLFKTKWEGAKTCNLGVWKKDFIAVNGFDESYYGWGYEDSDLVVRLIRNGVLRKDGRFSVPVFHLWHPNNICERKDINYQKLQDTINSDRIVADDGVNKY